MVQSLLFVHISKFETIPQCWSRWWWFVRRGVFEALGVAHPVFRPHMAPDIAALPPCVFSSPPVTFFISSLPSSTLASSSPTTLSSAAIPQINAGYLLSKTVDRGAPAVIWRVFCEGAINQGVGTEEDSAWRECWRDRGHHYRTPVQYCSSKERRGWIACVVPWWPWGRWSIKPPSKKTHRKLQSVMRVVPVPIFPKPQQHSSHRSPLVLVVSRPILPEPQQRRHWMTCTSRTIPITENLAKV